ncbi:S8 family serine peptidase [Sphingomonas sp. AOB5]|uniref:S8 family serine peptidase n=1 Tax=Sphingomonas sp. AOB5 TaxID=3034017 RepID=UPI0023F664C9|nr:S8 family serine peptidase [Sphingomonas sp. AOB5]MDF7777163.1 S8 family serine peptidase [Sphingomonas sp. AOB5]
MRSRWWIALAALVAPLAAAAQVVPLPSVPDGLGVPRIGVPSLPLTDRVVQDVSGLARDRIARLRNIARRNPDRIEIDRTGNPVRAGEVVMTAPDDASIAAATRAGFRLIERSSVEGVDIGFARFAAPRGMSVDRALREMRKAAPGVEVSADPLHFGSGTAEASVPQLLRPLPAPAAGEARVGIIDGGVNARLVNARIVQHGFATGGSVPNDHATGIAVLISGGGGVRGAAPSASLFVADVYGRDPAGGNATAIARALGWMVSQYIPVVTISLVGPFNPLLARTIAAAQAKGVIVVAAVGNDGPAAPPAFPASYPGVIAVTGVDGRNRALIEAGRANHLDYAAPGADMVTLDINGRTVSVRGTSFAAPLVAARLAVIYGSTDLGRYGPAIRQLDGEAQDLGPRGPDKSFGRGLVCGTCRTPRK